MNRRGFTYLELLVVFAVVGILTRLTLPKLQQVRGKATAARIVGDYHAIKLAAFSHHTATRTWPAEQGPGVRPPELADELAAGLTFRRPEYELDWENWPLPGGLPSRPGASNVVGLTVTTTDPEVGRHVLRVLGPNTIHFSSGGGTTYVIEIN